MPKYTLRLLAKFYQTTNGRCRIIIVHFLLARNCILTHEFVLNFFYDFALRTLQFDVQVCCSDSDPIYYPIPTSYILRQQKYNLYSDPIYS